MLHHTRRCSRISDALEDGAMCDGWKHNGPYPRLMSGGPVPGTVYGGAVTAVTAGTAVAVTAVTNVCFTVTHYDHTMPPYLTIIPHCHTLPSYLTVIPYHRYLIIIPYHRYLIIIPYHYSLLSYLTTITFYHTSPLSYLKLLYQNVMMFSGDFDLFVKVIQSLNK